MTDTAHDAAGIPSDVPRPRRILWGRIISLIGAMGLCVSFFLPHYITFSPFRMCPRPSGEDTSMGSIAPVDTIATLGRLKGIFLLKDIHDLLPFASAALLVPLLAFRSIPKLDGPRKAAAALFAAWAYDRIDFAFSIHFIWGSLFSVLNPVGKWVSLAACVLLVLGAVVDWFQSRPATSSHLGH